MTAAGLAGKQCQARLRLADVRTSVAHHDFLDSFLNYCHAAGSRASRA
jgi:hypothetical protein